MNRNGILGSTIILLIVIYCFLIAFEFQLRVQTNFWVIFTEFVICIAVLFLTAFLKINGGQKLIGLALVLLLFLFIIPRSGLWKLSLSRYVEKENKEYLEITKTLESLNNDELYYIACRKGKVNYRPAKIELKTDSNKETLNQFCAQIENLDCLEIFLSKDKQYLFIMSRFIDNGYGLLYTTEKTSRQSLFENRISGFDITSATKINEHWYYVSFT